MTVSPTAVPRAALAPSASRTRSPQDVFRGLLSPPLCLARLLLLSLLLVLRAIAVLSGEPDIEVHTTCLRVSC